MKRIYVRGPAAKRFLAHVDKNGPVPSHRPDLGPCHLWVGATPHGYGQFWDGERRVPAHRWAYEQKHGPIAHGLEPDHLCRVQACVNAAHLESVTHAENMRRSPHAKVAFGRALVNRAKTHCPSGHEYSQENTRIKNGSRNCKECGRIEVRQRRERRT